MDEPKKSPPRVMAVLISFCLFLSKNIKIACRVAGRYIKIIGVEIVSLLGKIGRRCADIIKSFAGFMANLVKECAVNSAKTFVKVSGPVVRFTQKTLLSVGSCSWDILKKIVSTVFGVVWSFLAAIFGSIFGWLSKKFRQPLLDVWCFILTPFAHAWGGLVNAGIRLKKAWKRGFIYAVGSVIGSVWRFFGTVAEIIRFLFNYLAPVVCIAFLIGLIRYSSTLQYAISVNYNGNDIGTIENEAAYNEAQTLVQDKVTFTTNDKPILVTPTFSVTVINMDESEKQPESDIDALSETMIETGEVNIVYAYELDINGELFGVYTEEDMQTIRKAMEDKLNSYSTPNAVNVSFEDTIVFQEGRFIEDVLCSTDEALELITGGTDVEKYYKIESGDTISKICEKLGITEDDFAKYNPEMVANGLYAGDLVAYHITEPYLNVLTTYFEAYGQVIERTTEYSEVSWLEKYNETLIQHGSDGYENVTALVTLTNGVESGREIVSRNIVEEMVPRKYRTGTAPNTYLDDTSIIDTLGTFCWPVGGSGGYISTVPGWRSWDQSNHMALDIAGIPSGTPIYAACSGRVTMSRWYGAYGKLVVIDCGYGYECYYGHCSELLVTEGQWVEKGDTIAEVGMTGSASGYHLHFEMRYRNQRINPLEALGGYGGHDIRQ